MTEKRTIRLDSLGGVPAYGERSATSSPGESQKDDKGRSPHRKNIAEAKQRSTPIQGLDLDYGLGLKGSNEQIEVPSVG